jgi:hypothetical protein
MSLLRKYCIDNYGLTNDTFNEMSLEEREALSQTYGYLLHIDVLNIEIAWDKFVDSLFESRKSRLGKWMLRMLFKIKGIKL